MAFSYTISQPAKNMGAVRMVHGTFTSATGDTSSTITKSTHGLNEVMFAFFTLDTGGVAVQTPKMTISNDSITVLWDDTLGYSGRFAIVGR